MQGKAGQCPHCSAKFIVPVLTEAEEIEELEAPHEAGEDADSVRELLGALEKEEYSPPAPSISPPKTWQTSVVSVSNPEPAKRSTHSLCELMGKLWEEKQHGAIIELHLEGGALLTPDWFDEPLSRQSHGLFAAQSADGTVTMTVVAWEKVTRVVVRNVEGLPHGMFE
jgi:hypothetical protein